MSICNKRFVQQRVLAAAFTLFMMAVVVGCANTADNEATVTPTPSPLPTLPLSTVDANPTPTLSSGAPTRALPTPMITRSSMQGATASEIIASPSPAGPTATPSPTPMIAERLAIGEQALTIGDFALAAEQFGKALQQEPALDAPQQADTLLKLGRSFLADRRYTDAATVLNQLIALRPESLASETYFWLGQAYAGQGDLDAAIAAYEEFLAQDPQIGGYVYPLIAEAYATLGSGEQAIQAYQSALEAPVFRLKEVQTRLALANAHLAAGSSDAAIAQYDAIHDLAETEATRGQMTYLAGAAELAAGDVFAAHERFQRGITDYPAAYESYLGLVELVKAEVEVDPYQRGLVDYYAAAYAPAIEAFADYIASPPAEFKADSHLYLALSHEAMGDFDSAFTQLERYTVREQPNGLLEQARMRERAGESETAGTLYRRYLELYADEEDAPLAAWSLAQLSAGLEEWEEAIAQFTDLVDQYPTADRAPEALFRAGSLAAANEDLQMARDLWIRAAVEYPAAFYGSAALLALVRADATAVNESELLAERLAGGPTSTTYQELRAHDLLAGNAPFAPASDFVIPADETVDQEAAEAWLAAQFDLDIDSVTADLSPALRQDDRLAVGQRLWQLGLYEEAKRELEALRQAYADDPLSSYQLALFFRDLGLYRSAIIAGNTVLRLADTHELDAPRFIGRLVYPVHYADLILPLAEQYGYDPRLQFSLVRQESLFESFARSGAAAQGLSQVIPDTGAWIAEQLQWPDYDNEDLYKPYVGLAFGAYYLSTQLNYFDDVVHAALAAYNAGPGNAARWYEAAGGDLDQFVDTVDFSETRTYIERIYSGFKIYDYLYGEE